MKLKQCSLDDLNKEEIDSYINALQVNKEIMEDKVREYGKEYLKYKQELERVESFIKFTSKED